MYMQLNEQFIVDERGSKQIETRQRTSLLTFLAACVPSDVDFPDIDDLPPLELSEHQYSTCCGNAGNNTDRSTTSAGI